MANFEEKKKKYTRNFWIIFATPFAVLFLLFFLISEGWLGYMPKFEELENPQIDLAARVLTEDRELLGKYFNPKNNRTTVNYQELSPYLVNALIATEDIRFHKHSGIDARGLVRAVVFLGNRGGASTITQQLAKQLYHERSPSILVRLWQKFNEWVIAVKLEKSYTKEEIIAMYLNQVDFLNLAVGVESASSVYFNTTPDSLKLEEAAALVGMVQNPSVYNPLRRPELTQKRRNIVLRQLYKYKYITEEVYDSVKTIPLSIDYQRVDHSEGYGTYFREYLRLIMNADKPERSDYGSYASYKGDSLDWVKDPLFGWCNKNKKPDGSTYNLYNDGLRIYTTINYKMQQHAEQAVKKHLGEYLQPAFNNEKEGKRGAPFSNDLTSREVDNIMQSSMRRSNRYRTLRAAGVSMDSIRESFKTPVEMRVFTWNGEVDTVMTPWDSILYYKHILRVGMMSADPRTGHVKTYVGGPDLAHFQYDHVKFGKRQAGSTFKPFLYVLAWQEGYSPCRKVPVTPQVFPDQDSIWSPRTTGTKYIGTEQTLKWGLAKSENLISAWLLKNFTPQSIVDMAHKLGIESPLDPVYSMIYGVSDVSVYEMVSAFSTFANKGVHIQPIFVTRIEDKNGNLLSTFQPTVEEAVSEQTAYLMLNAMQGTVNFGTAIGLRTRFGFESEIAGKTGTTQNNSDGWFMGIVPKMVTGIWVGGEERSIRFDNNHIGQGAYMAMPIWAHFMKKIYEDDEINISPEDEFDMPDNLNVQVNCDEYVPDDYASPSDNYGISGYGLGY